MKIMINGFNYLKTESGVSKERAPKLPREFFAWLFIVIVPLNLML